MLAEYGDGMQSTGPPRPERHQPPVGENPDRPGRLDSGSREGDPGLQVTGTDRVSVQYTRQAGGRQLHGGEVWQRCRGCDQPVGEAWSEGVGGFDAERRPNHKRPAANPP